MRHGIKKVKETLEQTKAATKQIRKETTFTYQKLASAKRETKLLCGQLKQIKSSVEVGRYTSYVLSPPILDISAHHACIHSIMNPNSEKQKTICRQPKVEPTSHMAAYTQTTFPPPPVLPPKWMTPLCKSKMKTWTSRTGTKYLRPARVPDELTALSMDLMAGPANVKASQVSYVINRCFGAALGQSMDAYHFGHRKTHNNYRSTVEFLVRIQLGCMLTRAHWDMQESD